MMGTVGAKVDEIADWAQSAKQGTGEQRRGLRGYAKETVGGAEVSIATKKREHTTIATPGQALLVGLIPVAIAQAADPRQIPVGKGQSSAQGIQTGKLIADWYS
jgi:hypothetical protein